MIITIVATLAGVLVGLLLRSRLRTLSYRQPYDDTDHKGRRPTHRWVTLLVPLCWAWLSWALAPNWWAVLLWLPLSAALIWASAIDLDVRRLPNPILAAIGLWAAGLLVLQAVITTKPQPLLEAVVSAAVCAVIFFLLHLASPNGMGFGDVKLVAVLATATAGTAGWPTAVAMIVGGCLTALIAMLVTRRRDIAFGPYLALAAVSTVGVATRL